ncbi:signal peptidase I [Antribacter sp. KLBMP9083]|uniref:Signal peptidase I n=1 Tax=Antribacter soli TaxID=2910976 RepID=A0AA41QGV1_9MICO|nr:signal peptidase I [Antribacter soli]MCF4122902.1 signal peptidase I [Antribacter soli]
MTDADPWAASAQESRQEDPRAERSGGFLAMLKETAIIVVSALVLSWIIKSFLVQAFFIPSASMQDTLEVGDRVMVSRLTPGPFDLRRGDIVVFKDPGGWLGPYVPPDRGPVGNAITSGLTFVGLLPQDTGEHLIKRVIGLPGDHVVCCDAEGRVTVNDVDLTETSYIAPGSVPSQDPFDTVVPEGMLFVMGDNRQNSQDSRYNTSKPGGGFVPVENVVGAAFATVWPFDRATWLSNPSEVFEYVPDADDASALGLVVRREEAAL